MPVKPKLVKAINDQIQAEFQSAYEYLAMSAWFSQNNLPGFAHWMRMQWQEETMHAMKLYQFLHDRGGDVALQAIAAPVGKYSNALQVFESVRKHEQSITDKINTLYDLAVKEKDLPLQIVLQWFINEQVEEESAVAEIIDQLKLIGGDGPSIYLLDRQMASRTLPAATTPA
jgi:ferritin